MPKKINETGKIYGQWTVLREATKEETNGRKGGTFWKCKCVCGNEGIIAGFSLRNGDSTSCGCFSKEKISRLGKEILLKDRTGEENINYQNCKMIIIIYNSANDLIVEFQDVHKAKVHCDYKSFKNGKVKNPYYPEVYGIGIIGQKYKTFENEHEVKEYKVWHSVLQRCYDSKIHLKQPTYRDCSISEEWKFYENFYEWIHNQENYLKWSTNERWAIDKDILVKGNKIYGSEFCSLIPERVNALFTKRQNDRGNYPIGVYYYKAGDYFKAQCMNPLLNKRICIGSYNNPIEAFNAYKKYKEKLIKEIATIEFNNNNITQRCYEAMMNYQVEITD